MILPTSRFLSLSVPVTELHEQEGPKVDRDPSHSMFKNGLEYFNGLEGFVGMDN